MLSILSHCDTAVPRQGTQLWFNTFWEDICGFWAALWTLECVSVVWHPVVLTGCCNKEEALSSSLRRCGRVQVGQELWERREPSHLLILQQPDSGPLGLASLSDLHSKYAETYVASWCWTLPASYAEGNQSFILKSLFCLYQQLDSCLHFSHSKIIMFPLWQRKLSFISRESYTRSRQNTSVNNKSNDDWTFQGAFTSFRYFRALRSISETNTLWCIC